MQNDKPPFLIGHIAALLRWFELLLFTISAPVLMAATAIAAIDILTGGALLANNPGMLFAFGVALAIGIDVLLPAACERVREAWEHKRWGTLLLWATIALWTGYVIFTALQVFSIEQAQHVSEQQALLMIGISPEQFHFNRDLLTVVLLGLSGFARVHQRPIGRKEERDQLEKELELEPLRQRLEAVKAQRLVGAVHAGKAVIAAAKATPATTVTVTPDPDPDPEPPTPAGPGPSRKRSRRDIGRSVEETERLKDRIRPHVLAMSADGQSFVQIAERLSTPAQPVTSFMVQQIVKREKIQKGVA